jgi:hypothetical protein
MGPFLMRNLVLVHSLDQLRYARNQLFREPGRQLRARLSPTEIMVTNFHVGWGQVS